MLEADLHVHSSFTIDAFNTAYEMVGEARAKGIKMIAICDHSPADDVTPDIPGHHTIEHYCSTRRKRIKVEEVDLIWGIEVEIIDEKGRLDPKVTKEVLGKQDLVIASFHGMKYLKPGIVKKEANPAKAMIVAMENPLIDVIAHPFLFTTDQEIKKIVNAAVVQKVPLELNNSYLVPPRDYQKYQAKATLMARLLREKGGKIFVGSDAHIAWELGGDEGIKEVLRQTDFDTKNIVNWTARQANEFLAHRRRDA